LVYFGPQTRKSLTVINLHPNGLRRCCEPAPHNFYTIEIDQSLLALTRRGTGSPPPKKNREDLKCGLKSSVLESITSGIVEVFSINFFSCDLPSLREEFRLPEFILQSNLLRRAASSLALPCPSSFLLLARYTLSQIRLSVRPSVRHTGGSVENG